MGDANEVVMLINYLKAGDWNTIVHQLGTAGDALKPLLATKNNIETFLTIPLVSKAGLSFPGVIIPIAAGLSTYLQSKLTMAMNPSQNDPSNPAAAMTKSMIYTMPIVMGVFSVNMPAGLGLYWTISNIFGILQQVVLQKHFRKKFAEEAEQNG
jgi:YidC/Oxa1 family membrane protein insertase